MKGRALVNCLCGALVASSPLMGAPAGAADLSPKYGSLTEQLSDNNHEIQKHPGLASMYVDRAETYQSMGRLKDAMDDVNKAISLDPQEDTAYAERGDLWRQMKNYKQALADLNQAIQMDPLNASYVHRKGKVYEALGQSDLATKTYNQAKILGYGDNGPDFGPYMADLQRRIKRAWFPPKGDESKEVVTEFWISRDGTASGAEIYRSSGIPLADAAALKAISNASPLRPLPLGSNRKVQIQFSFTYNVYGSESRSRTIVKTTSLPTAETKTYKTGTLTFSDWTKIESDLKKKLADAEKKGDELGAVSPLLSLADGYSDRGKYDQAESAYKRAEAILEKQKNKQSETVKVMGRLAQMYASQGKSAEAEALYKQVLDKTKQAADEELSPSSREIMTAYAKLLYKSSRFDEANKLYARLKEE